MSREHKLSLRIADIDLNLKSSIPFDKLLLKKNLNLFQSISSNSKNSINIIINESSDLKNIYGTVHYDPGDMWKLYKDRGEVSAVIFDEKKRPKCVIKPSKGWNDNFVKIKFYGDEDRSIIDSGTLELIFRTNLILNRGVVFHSSLVDDNGKGILFTGNSGDGKSTQSNFWKDVEGAEIVNEDRNAVRISDDGLHGYGIPWGGTAQKVANKKVKLNAILLISKSQSNRVELIQTEKAVPMLIARSFFPFWDEELAGKAVDNINNIASRIPVYMLHCKPEKEIVGLVRKIL